MTVGCARSASKWQLARAWPRAISETPPMLTRKYKSMVAVRFMGKQCLPAISGIREMGHVWHRDGIGGL